MLQRSALSRMLVHGQGSFNLVCSVDMMMLKIYAKVTSFEMAPCLQFHLVDSIVLMGHVRNYDANFYEHANLYDKLLYRATSRRNRTYLKEMVNQAVMRDIGVAAMEQCCPVSEKINHTSSQEAANQDRHAMSKYGQQLSLPVLSQRIPARNHLNVARKRTIKKSVQFLKEQPELRQLSTLIQDYIKRQRLDITMQEDVFKGNVHRTTFIEQITSATLLDEIEYLPYRPMRTVRASHSYQDRPVFDSVEIYKTSRSTKPSYAQLRLMFRYQKQDLCLVRWYDVDDTEVLDNTLSKHGCTRLKWAQSTKTKQPEYSVVSLYSIRRSLYVIPDYDTRDQLEVHQRFYVSAFKWHNDVATKKSDPPVGTDSLLEQRWLCAASKEDLDDIYGQHVEGEFQGRSLFCIAIMLVPWIEINLGICFLVFVAGCFVSLLMHKT